jgi:hypothetical protein
MHAVAADVEGQRTGRSVSCDVLLFFFFLRLSVLLCPFRDAREYEAHQIRFEYLLCTAMGSPEAKCKQGMRRQCQQDDEMD